MSELEEVTVRLIPEAVEAMNRAANRDELSRTDVINRALQLYDAVADGLLSGRVVVEGDGDFGYRLRRSS